MLRVPPSAPCSSNSVVDQAPAPSTLAPLSARLKVCWQGVGIIEPTIVWRLLVLTHLILASQSSVANSEGKVVRHDVVCHNTLAVSCSCSVAIRVNLSEML